MKNVVKPLAKSVLIRLESTSAATKDTAIHEKTFGVITLITLNAEMNDIMKIVRSLE